MCVFIGSFDFNKIKEGLPKAIQSRGHSWFLTRILTDMKSSMLDTHYCGETPEEFKLESLSISDVQLKNVKDSARYPNGTYAFTNPKLYVYYIFHGKKLEDNQSAVNSNASLDIEEQQGIESVFWSHGELSRNEGIENLICEHTKRYTINSGYSSEIKGLSDDNKSFAFLSFIRGRIIFGRNELGVLWQNGSTLSNVAFDPDMKNLKENIIFVFEKPNMYVPLYDIV